MQNIRQSFTKKEVEAINKFAEKNGFSFSEACRTLIESIGAGFSPDTDGDLIYKSLTLSPETVKKIEKLAKKSGLKKSDLIRLMIKRSPLFME